MPGESDPCNACVFHKGQAKFNKQKKQLVVTLPVLPLKEPLLTAESPELVGDTEEQLNGPSAEEEREKTSTTENSTGPTPPFSPSLYYANE